MRDLALRVNGRDYAGWKSARVRRELESISGSFDLSVTDRWPGQKDSWPILEGDECSLSLGDTKVITGFIDRRAISVGPEELTASVSGRDAAADLVDCSAVLEAGWEFKNVVLLDFAQTLCKPHGISVKGAEYGIDAKQRIEKVDFSPGDTVFDVLEQLCRKARVFLCSDGRGGLVLTGPAASRARTALEEGKNILRASADFNRTGMFSEYIVHGGRPPKGGSPVLEGASDPTVSRKNRVHIIRGDGTIATKAQAKARAEWEATVRAARAYVVNVTVQGWEQADGSLWPVNGLVHVQSKSLGVDSEMLICSVEFSLDDGGTTTTLELKRPDAFRPQPLDDKPGKPGIDPWIVGKV